MRPLTVFLATIQFLVMLASAHPFVIVKTTIERPRPTAHQKRQGILNGVKSAVDDIFRRDDDEEEERTKSAVTTKAAVTLVPPMTASTSSTAQESKTAASAKDDDEDEDRGKGDKDQDDEQDDDQDDDQDEDDQATSSEETTSTEVESSTISETSTTKAPTTNFNTAPSTTAVPAPTSSLAALPAETSSASKDGGNDDGSGVPPGGVAVAVIMSLLMVGLAAWLVFKYHPRCQAWWTARQEKKRKERSYREAIDGPSADSSRTLRQEALGESSERRTMLQSFFAPTTVKLGNGKEIKRKPVNWGAGAGSSIGSGTEGTEKISMTATAAPLGQIERYSVMQRLDEQTNPSTQSAVSPVSLRPKESLEKLPPISPISTHQRNLASITSVQAQRDLPELPPVPSLPQLSHAKRGSDGLFRLG